MATGATEFFDVTVAKGSGGGLDTTFIPQVWSKAAIVAREQQLIFANLVNRVFEKDLASYGDKVHVPSVSDLTVQSKNLSNNAATVFETITEANTDITIDTWEYSALAVETATRRLSNRDLLKLYSHKQGYALAQSVDNVLAGYIDNQTGNPVGTLAVPLGYDDVLQARQNLDDAEVPMEDRVMAISPAQERGFLQLDQFIHRDYDHLHGEPGKKALDRAFIGSWLNMPVYKSTNVEGTNAAGHDNGMFQKESFALVMALNATTHTMFDINYLANKVVVEQLYGSAIMRANHAIWMKGL